MQKIENSAAQTREVTGFIDFMVTDGIFVWATNQDRIQKFNTESYVPIAEIVVPSAAGIPAIGFGAIWAASLSEQCIYKIDCQTNEILAKVQTTFADQTGEFSLCASDTAIWWVSSEGCLSQMHPEQLNPRIATDVLMHSYNVCYAADAIWLTNTRHHSVQRIDPKQQKVTHTISTAKKPWFLSGSKDFIFSLNQASASISKIDAHNHIHLADYPLPALAAGDGGDIYVTSDRVYVRTTHVLFIELDLEGNILREIYAADGTGSGAVVSTNQHIWLTAHDVDRLWLLDKN